MHLRKKMLTLATAVLSALSDKLDGQAANS